MGKQSASDARSGVAPLRALLDVTRLVGSEVDVHEVLGAVAETISETLGFRTVAINLYRPAWDDFQIAIVYGNEEASRVLVGHTDPLERWAAVLDERFERRGAYWIPAEDAWQEPDGPRSYTPALDVSADEDAWHAEDSLIVPLQGTGGELLGMVSVDEPLNGRRPTDDEIEILVAVSAHAAFVLQAALVQDADERHLAALEHLLQVSAQLNETLDVDEILQEVCTGISEALGFRCVSVDLVDAAAGTFRARAAVGWSLDDPAISTATTVSDVEPLFDPQFAIEGCYLLPSEEAQARFRRETTYVSTQNGRGPHAWDHHWLLVPLHSRGGGELRGLIWVDEPEDQLVPSRETLQTLRVFANQAQAALESAAQFEEVRFLADHDPLTRLFNRRTYMSELESELDRAQRYGNGFALVLCDLDGFKQINDTHGHLAGDHALQRFAAVLNEGLRTSDRAFRIGGDEFALLLVATGAEAAEEAVARLNVALGAAEGGDAPLSASFGTAVYPADGTTATELARTADERLYVAKRKR